MGKIILKVENLNKSFGAVRATKDLSFEIEQGTIHALIGPNGAGKTTVVNQLSGDVLPDSGRIFFDSENIDKLKPYQRAARGLGRSFQITSVFENMSVAENLALAILSHRSHNFRFWKKALSAIEVKRHLTDALERVDLLNQAEVMARYLSHGEKRQLEVGMALSGKPKLLMLDEPMAGLGPGGTVELAKLIRRLKNEVTILLVEHDMEAVFSLADQISVIVYGTCIASGSPDEIRHDSEVRSAYLGED